MSKQRRERERFSEGRDFLKPLYRNKYEHLIFIGLIIALLSVFFFKMAYMGFSPKAGDTMQWRSAAQVLIEYNSDKGNKDQALWNSNLFSGMPAFLINYPSKYPFVKDILNIISKYLINWSVLFMILAGVGMYVLMLSLGFRPMVAFISGMAFAVSCHFIGLIEIGHNTKYRAVVYIPWIMWGIDYLFKKRSILGMGLTATFLIMQLRENHIQITYYTFIMILVYWIFSFFWFKKDFEMKQFFFASLMFIGTLIITGLAVTHPYLSVWEYGKYTIRGGGGLTTEYATSWSFHPLEIITFIIPDFFGGVSPYYWGWMPFTQTSMYVGVIVFALALLAAICWNKRMVRMLSVTTVVALILSFGRHFPLLSNFLLSYLPFFNKFRVPAMILVLAQFSLVVLAGYGIREIYDRYKDNDERFKSLMLKVFIGCVVVLVLFVAISASGGWFKLPLQQENDANSYDARQLSYLREHRAAVLEKSSILSFAFLSAFFLLTYLMLSRKGVSPYLYLTLIAALTLTDIMLINKRHFTNLEHKSKIQQEFVKTDTDKFLLEDNELFRVFPIREEFGQSRWAYHHQSIGGYHGAKLRRYQEVIDNTLYVELKYRVPLNWNIVRMLNVKYLISPVQLPFENLEWAFYDRVKRVTVYKYSNMLPRAWFVDQVETLYDKESIFRRLNYPDFDPEKTAILETPIGRIEPPENSSVEVTKHSLNRIEMNVATDKQSFLVLSEIYYPAGWKAYLNGKEIDIHPTNYILRGMEIPAGKHKLEVVFAPTTHKLASILSLIGLLATTLLVVIGGYIYRKENYSGGIDFVLKGENDR